MTGNQAETFGRRLTVVAEVFDKRLSAAQTALYFEALRDLPWAVVVHALRVSVQTCKFFPRPAELREFAIGDVEDAIERAWVALRQAGGRLGAYASVIVQDAALAETVLALFGSWAAACQAEFSPEMWAAKRKEFGRVYRLMMQRRLDGARYLVGQCEADNVGRGYTTRFIAVGHIGQDGAIRQLSAAEAERERVTIAAHAHGLTSVADLAPAVLDVVLTGPDA
jgi:hypothetical protein